jgi:hypothetical protein
MAVVELGPNGEIKVLVPPTPEEVAEAEVALHRVIKALAELAVEREWAGRREGLAAGGEQHTAEAGDGRDL